MLEIKTELLSTHDLKKAADYLLNEQVVAFPTETVYGLGACLFSEKAIQSIFQVKGRPSDNPLIVHISSLSCISDLAVDIPKEFYLLSRLFFPGPLTLIVPKHPQVPSLISAGLDTIAIRMPAHPIAKALIDLVGQPLVAPSANLSGKPSATHFQHVLDDFEGKIPAIVMGEGVDIGIESTVVSLLNGDVEILRPGSITKEQIESAFQRPVRMFNPSKEDRSYPSPGMKYRHYAPLAKVTLFYIKEQVKEYCKTIASKKMVLSNDASAYIECYDLSCKTLYAHLRLADDLGCSEVVVFCDEKVTQDLGLMNRLLKASSKC